MTPDEYILCLLALFLIVELQIAVLIWELNKRRRKNQ